MSRIASSVFNGSPLDQLAAVDAYKTTDASLRTRFQSSFNAFTQNFANALGGQQSALRNVLGTLTSDGEFDVSLAKDRFNRIMTSSRSQVQKLSDDLQSEILGNLGIDDATARNLQIKIGQSVQQIENGTFHNTAGIVAMANDLSGEELFKLIDAEAEIGVFQGVLDQVIQWRIPEAIDRVLANINDPVTRRRVVQRSTSRLATSGDIDGIETFLKHSDPYALLSQRPDFPRQVLQQYRFRGDITPADYPAKLDQLVSVMNQLNPEWFQTTRGEESVVNLSYIAYASDDALTLLNSSETYRSAALTGPNFPQKTFKSLLRDMYPLMPIVD